jgi:hypothetical protein
MVVLGVACLISSSGACKAKSCDAANNIYESDQRSKRKVKQIGLFSKREMRRKRWH